MIKARTIDHTFNDNNDMGIIIVVTTNFIKTKLVRIKGSAAVRKQAKKIAQFSSSYPGMVAQMERFLSSML